MIDYRCCFANMRKSYISKFALLASNIKHFLFVLGITENSFLNFHTGVYLCVFKARSILFLRQCLTKRVYYVYKNLVFLPDFKVKHLNLIVYLQILSKETS